MALVLDALGQPEAWQRFETALNRRIIRVYQLNPQRVRLDSTTVSGYWTVREDGLFQLGYSKDHRPDLPQLKVMLSALDPLGLPLATQVVAGQVADDPLYIPAIKQVSQSLQGHGMLYVGDCKMAALSTRAYVQAKETTTCVRWRTHNCPIRSWTRICSPSGAGSVPWWPCIVRRGGAANSSLRAMTDCRAEWRSGGPSSHLDRAAADCAFRQAR